MFSVTDLSRFLFIHSRVHDSLVLNLSDSMNMLSKKKLRKASLRKVVGSVTVTKAGDIPEKDGDK